MNDVYPDNESFEFKQPTEHDKLDITIPDLTTIENKQKFLYQCLTYKTDNEQKQTYTYNNGIHFTFNQRTNNNDNCSLLIEYIETKNPNKKKRILIPLKTFGSQIKQFSNFISNFNLKEFLDNINKKNKQKDNNNTNYTKTKVQQHIQVALNAVLHILYANAYKINKILQQRKNQHYHANLQKLFDNLLKPDKMFVYQKNQNDKYRFTLKDGCFFLQKKNCDEEFQEIADLTSILADPEIENNFNTINKETNPLQWIIQNKKEDIMQLLNKNKLNEEDKMGICKILAIDYNKPFPKTINWHYCSLCQSCCWR